MKIARRSHLVVVPERPSDPDPDYGRSWYDEQDRLQRLQEEQVAESDHHALPEVCPEDDHEWVIEVCVRCWLARTT